MFLAAEEKTSVLTCLFCATRPCTGRILCNMKYNDVIKTSFVL